MKNTVIIGGGISGLAAAYRLRKLAPEMAITLIERNDRLGGKIVTESVEGFLVEGAPDCFLSRKPRGIGLCEELGIADRLVGRDPRHRKTFVLREGQLHRLPEGLTGMIPTNLDALASSTLLSADAKQRVALEPDLPPAVGDEDESIASFVTRRLGREVYEQLVEPLMSGIYGGDGTQLSLAATFPQLRQLEREHGSLITGLLAAQGKAPAAPAYPPFVSFPNGMGELVSALTDRLREVDVNLGVGVASIQPQAGGGYAVTLENGKTIQADALILTTPAHVTAQLLRDVDAALADAHAAIPYGSSATISLAYAPSVVGGRSSAVHPLDGYGYVIPRVEDTDVLACTWTSSKWEGRAPDGSALIRVYVGRFGRRDVLTDDDAQLVAMACDELARTLGVTAGPLFHRVFRWPKSMPQYTLGHTQRLSEIDERMDQIPGLFLAGAAYRGVGIPDCIREGEQAAQDLFQDSHTELHRGGTETTEENIDP